MASFTFRILHKAHAPLFKDWQDIGYTSVSTQETECTLSADTRNQALKKLLEWLDELEWYNIQDVDLAAEEDDWFDDDDDMVDDEFQDRCGEYEEDGTFDDWNDGWD